MNNIINNHPRTVLAGALSVALMFAAGGVMAQDTVQQQDRVGQHDQQDRVGQQDRLGQQDQHDRMGQHDQTDRDSDQPVNDTWITTKVKSSLLADTDVAGLDVEVETVNGEVRLSGDVDSQAQIDQATRIARDIEGVTRVDTSRLTTVAGTGDF